MKVLVISLPGCQTRRESAGGQLADRSIAFEFLDGVDGRSPGHPLLARYDESQFIVNCGRPANPGELGCYASHFLAWERCVAHDEPVLILEDDFVLQDGFPAALSLCEQLLPAYGHIRLEATTRSIAVPEQQFGAFRLVKYVKAPQGALAYGIAPAAARSLLRHSSTFAAPVDVFVRNFFRHKVPLFGLYPYTVANGELSGDSLIGRRVKPAQPAPVALRRFLKKGFRLAMNGKENLLYAAGLRRPCCSD
jgi:glycosyl transferase family 25